ncbi:hypothetical protein [Chromohalobacter sp. HP20-39]|uniref:hypothetical protein n=1 Tax=Chromohalobacter sp. HP20-39 TaxID=3079306 RepID=UPI00294B087B|nr:hypothetical protein [Chromohalobacter sp. HP20-39]MDV6318648.1 hypothetical protein [Chromohalobacter sp. HP20-39]
MKRRVLVRFRIPASLLLLVVGSRCVSFIVVGDSLAMFQSGGVVFVVADAGLSTWAYVVVVVRAPQASGCCFS